MMVIIQPTYLPKPLQRMLVTNVTPECIGRVCGIGNDAAAAHNIDCLNDQPMLGIIGMYSEKLTHNA